jgi:hypothetical protein
MIVLYVVGTLLVCFAIADVLVGIVEWIISPPR